MTIHDVSVGDLVIDPCYGRIEDIWIGNKGVWYAVVSGKSVPLDNVKKVISKIHLKDGGDKRERFL